MLGSRSVQNSHLSFLPHQTLKFKKSEVQSSNLKVWDVTPQCGILNFKFWTLLRPRLRHWTVFCFEMCLTLLHKQIRSNLKIIMTPKYTNINFQKKITTYFLMCVECHTRSSYCGLMPTIQLKCINILHLRTVAVPNAQTSFLYSKNYKAKLFLLYLPHIVNSDLFILYLLTVMRVRDFQDKCVSNVSDLSGSLHS